MRKKISPMLVSALYSSLVDCDDGVCGKVGMPHVPSCASILRALLFGFVSSSVSFLETCNGVTTTTTVHLLASWCAMFCYGIFQFSPTYLAVVIDIDTVLNGVSTETTGLGDFSDYSLYSCAVFLHV